MSDPYNSYGIRVPSMGSVAHGVPADPQDDVIAWLSVSATWKHRFRLIDKAGGAQLPGYRALALGERYRLHANWLALLFGPCYYLLKGLWRQVIVYTALAMLTVVMLELIGLRDAHVSVSHGYAVIYCWRANISYYKKMVMDATPWL